MAMIPAEGKAGQAVRSARSKSRDRAVVGLNQALDRYFRAHAIDNLVDDGLLLAHVDTVDGLIRAKAIGEGLVQSDSVEAKNRYPVAVLLQRHDD